MWIIDFLKANCKNCYACVRACPMHAIAVKDEQAKIMKERCIGCGRCLKVCPKNAKHIQSEREKVEAYLQQGEEVIASVAPAFASLLKNRPKRLVTALRKLGFKRIEETVVGADLVTKAYGAYCAKQEQSCYITSCCPTVNAMIEKHVPEALPYLIPVGSPAICHARLIKAQRGNSVKVVFIGPCLSKKIEAIEEDAIDGVLTFEEVKEWLEEKQMNMEALEETEFDVTNATERNYPSLGGVTERVNLHGRKVIKVEGIEDCQEMLHHLSEEVFKNTLIEVHGCIHSCLAGAGMPQDGVSIFERQERLKAYATKAQEEIRPREAIEVGKGYMNLKKPLKKPTELEIKNILKSIGKETKLDELNCGGCGYPTCHEKAIAVYNGLAEPTMCLPFMRQKAERLTNDLFEATPNMIIMVNKDYEILEINPAAKCFFKLQKNMVYEPIAFLLDPKAFEKVQQTHEAVLNERIVIKEGVVIQSIIWSAYHEVMLWIGNDITLAERRAKQLKNMKIEAIDMAQQVINKQMTVAQEIASLLGETTAETKVTLTKLKQLIQKEEEL